ncbi:MAG TPA: DNA internalization-related competence protein ComEC/Rec2, partial [Rhodocyclaceae bacterium]|nr:DNA internalization-related competence protein ComEC/Rec2 [Rhodocyclaceae bacterium]
LAMADAAELSRIDVLQVAHHGSRSSSSPRFVAATAPQWALFPLGYRNPFGHPHDEVVERYRAQGTRLLRTDRDGAIHVELGQQLVVKTSRDEAPRYWFGR